jgi:hypothetical protein
VPYDTTADFVAETLGERDASPREQIQAIVETLGETDTLALLARTERIENGGGMVLPDGTRRRTRGGVFFQLARKALTPEQREAIFPRSVEPESPLRERTVAMTPLIAEATKGQKLVRYRPRAPTVATVPAERPVPGVQPEASSLEKLIPPMRHNQPKASSKMSARPTEPAWVQQLDRNIRSIATDFARDLATDLDTALRASVHDSIRAYFDGAATTERRARPTGKRSVPGEDLRADAHALMERVFAIVKEAPGLRAVDIAERLGTTPSAIAKSLVMLIATGRIEKRGQTRGTRYYRAGRAPAD